MIKKPPSGYPSFEARTLATQQAVREAILTHAKLGRPVSALRDGKVVWIQPEKVLATLAANPLPIKGNVSDKE